MKLENKIYITIFMGFFIVCLILITPIYVLVKQEMKEAIRERLVANAAAAALAYDGDELESIKRETLQNAHIIRKIEKTHARLIKIHNDIEFVYTMRKNDKGEVAFLVDCISIDKNGNGRIDLNEKSAPIGQVYKEATPQMFEAFAYPVADKESNTDKWGTFLSGYAPIFNSKNKVIAFVGVDMNIDSFQDKFENLKFIFYLVMIIALFLSLITTLILQKIMLKISME